VAADRLLICAYITLSGSPSQTQMTPPYRRMTGATEVTDLAEIEGIRAAVNRGKPLHYPGAGGPDIPAGASDQFLLFGDGNSIVTIHAHITGVTYATNGELTLGFADDTYFQQLGNLLPSDAWCDAYRPCQTNPAASESGPNK
jgi:hypothetical protein